MDLPENKIYTIGEAAKAVGVSISTLRRWDKEGKVKIGRKSNGYRAFTEAEVLLLKQTQSPQGTVPNIPPPQDCSTLPKAIKSYPPPLFSTFYPGFSSCCREYLSSCKNRLSPPGSPWR